MVSFVPPLKRLTERDPIGALWGVPVDVHGEVFQVNDSGGATIALAAPQGGGRERGCELVTPPLTAEVFPTSG